MNKNIKTKWLKALRSGEYIQGHDVLRNDDNEFCCLGVLCDLYSKEKKIKWKDGLMIDKGYTLPIEVKIWAGLKEENPLIKGIALSMWNDSNFEPKSFKQIATLIEKHL